MSKVKVTLLDNGPILIEGAIEMAGQYGNQVPETPSLYLCRCGGSKNKPFCDGTHKTIDFKG